MLLKKELMALLSIEFQAYFALKPLQNKRQQLQIK